MKIKVKIKKVIDKLQYYYCCTLIKFINLKQNIRYSNNNKYNKELSSKKKYLAIGFDDFRESDFNSIYPLFNKYNAKATYNRISSELSLSKKEIIKLYLIAKEQNEIGDHTWFHCNYIYNDPLFNGQDPNNIEGDQIIFPSNEQLRNDRGDGKNVFGFEIEKNISDNLSDWYDYDKNWAAFKCTWGNLSDEQCQIIRNSFSIYKDESGMLDLYDKLSNKYLGTTGKSRGSWDNNLKCYTGGIYTGSRTSCNHEIWERVLKITRLFYQDCFNNGFTFKTWSWPGSIPSPFVFQKDGNYYYDEKCTVLYNYLAQFPSTINKNNSDNYINRSWIQVLRDAGYTNTHDSLYPSKEDGQYTPAMRHQFIYNALLSRKDALIYSTDRSITYTNFAKAYQKSFFVKGKSIMAQMYDVKGEFRNFIEQLRQDTSNGIIHGEVIDSDGTNSEKIFLEQTLKFCKLANIEVISKQQAYDICFNKTIETGNLIYNPNLINSVKEYIPDAQNVPPNPDGYSGDCYVKLVDNYNTLCTNGITGYIHYGIPLGEITYSTHAKGNGEIRIYAIKNSDNIDLQINNLELLGSCIINSDQNKNYICEFVITDNPETEYEQLCGGLGNKITGIKIVYIGKLEVNRILLEKNNK